MGLVETSIRQDGPAFVQFRIAPILGQFNEVTERFAGIFEVALLVHVAFHPTAVVAQSLLNSSVREPPVEIIVPGEFVPV